MLRIEESEDLCEGLKTSQKMKEDSPKALWCIYMKQECAPRILHASYKAHTSVGRDTISASFFGACH